MLSRSSPCTTDRTGGQLNSFGNTDQSLVINSGMDTRPVITWVPWLSR